MTAQDNPRRQYKLYALTIIATQGQRVINSTKSKVPGDHFVEKLALKLWQGGKFGRYWKVKIQPQPEGTDVESGTGESNMGAIKHSAWLKMRDYIDDEER